MSYNNKTKYYTNLTSKKIQLRTSVLTRLQYILLHIQTNNRFTYNNNKIVVVEIFLEFISPSHAVLIL